MKNEQRATLAIAPEVNKGCATLRGSRVSAVAYRINAIPNKISPNQNGTFVKAAIGSFRDGIFRGGVIANLINMLAEALAAIPTNKITHFIT